MTYVIEQLYRDRVNEDTSNYATTKEWSLRSDTPLTIEQVYAYFVSDLTSTVQRLADQRRLSRFELETEEDSGGKYWIARLEWSGASGGTANEPEYEEEDPDIFPETFSTEGGTARVTQAYDETRYDCRDQPLGEDELPLTDHQGGIGWNGENYEGCDIVVPAFTFTLERTFDYDDVDTALKTSWADMTGKVNSTTFRGFSAGTVLFMGASGQTNVEYKGDLITKTETVDGEEVEVTYKKATKTYKVMFKFQCQQNFTDLEIANTSINKTGWQYYSVHRQEIDDADSGITIKKPLGVYVNTVYQTADLNSLIS